MKALKSTTGLICAITYMFFAMASIIYFIVKFVFYPPKSAFLGMHVYILTLPWSLVFTRLFDYFHIQDSIPAVIKILLFLVYALINASIFYWIGSKMEDTEIKDSN